MSVTTKIFQIKPKSYEALNLSPSLFPSPPPPTHTLVPVPLASSPTMTPSLTVLPLIHQTTWPHPHLWPLSSLCLSPNFYLSPALELYFNANLFRDVFCERHMTHIYKCLCTLKPKPFPAFSPEFVHHLTHICSHF